MTRCKRTALKLLLGAAIVAGFGYGLALHNQDMIMGWRMEWLKYSLERANPGADFDWSEDNFETEGWEIDYIEISTGDPYDRKLDLSPLAGMSVNLLWIQGNSLHTLEPLREMNLKSLVLFGCESVSDLSPLKGMNLEAITIIDTAISDLSPLRGMKLEYVYIDTENILDISPLDNMPLKEISLSNTKVGDLSPLRSANLTFIDINYRQLKELPKLKGQKISTVILGENMNYTTEFPKHIDLSVLEDFPVRKIIFEDYPFKNLSPIKNLKLEEIDISGSDCLEDISALKDMPLTRCFLLDIKYQGFKNSDPPKWLLDKNCHVLRWPKDKWWIDGIKN